MARDIREDNYTYDTAREALLFMRNFDFCLTGSFALWMHGCTARIPSNIDLYTTEEHADEFENACKAFVNVLSSKNYVVKVLSSSSSSFSAQVSKDGESTVCNLGIGKRTYRPLRNSVGPLLDFTDCTGHKMYAFLQRGEVRDLLDIEQIRLGGQFYETDLVKYAIRNHPDFDEEAFAEKVKQVANWDYSMVEPYGYSRPDFEVIRQHLLDWAQDLHYQSPNSIKYWAGNFSDDKANPNTAPVAL